jgi:hypothetical protein
MVNEQSTACRRFSASQTTIELKRQSQTICNATDVQEFLLIGQLILEIHGLDDSSSSLRSAEFIGLIKQSRGRHWIRGLTYINLYLVKIDSKLR